MGNMGLFNWMIIYYIIYKWIEYPIKKINGIFRTLKWRYCTI